MTTENVFTVQVRLTGALAAFVRAACTKSETSGAKFVIRALSNEAAEVNGADAPAPDPTPEKPVHARIGSKIKEAAELGLSTKEYKRRVKVLAEAGIAPTPQLVGNVPAKPARAKKPKAAPAAAA
jgi:hypothetical protein